jgi:arabinose-5-phosphate isomerase
MDILNEAKRMLDVQAHAIIKAKSHLDKNFELAVELILQCQGKVIVIGMGKSGIIGRKIAATMSSMGTLAIFLHPADAAHGDLGIAREQDIVLALSNSGYTEEIINLIPFFKNIKVKIIAIVGNPKSPLAQNADVVFDASIEKEIDHLNLAPTASAMVSLALGDTLAAVLAEIKGFKREDFGLCHPGGQLGKKLLLRVEDLMHTGNENSVLDQDSSVEDVLFELTSKRMGAVSLVHQGKLVGIITDGDLKRILQASKDRFFELKARDIMTKQPVTVRPEAKATEALELMEARSTQISVLPVVDGENYVRGILRLHDLMDIGLKSERKVDKD